MCRFSPNVLIRIRVSPLEEYVMGTILVTLNSCLTLDQIVYLNILKYGASWNVTMFIVVIAYAKKVWHKVK